MGWNRIGGRLGGIAIALGVWMCTSSSAEALDLVVDTTLDSAGANVQVCDPNPMLVDCSLRGAILRANATPGPHTITLPAGTYRLNTGGLGEDLGVTGDLDILQTVTINGAGSGSTVITGAEATSSDRDRIFHVLPQGNFTIRDVSIRKGGSPTFPFVYGGGVYAQGPLTIERASIRLNEMWGGPGLTLENTATVRDSALNGNTGAAVLVRGSGTFSVTIINSTISFNQGTSNAAGISIENTSPNTVTTLKNVTIANNVGNFGSGGGINKSGSSILILSNSIVANNSAPSNPNCAGAIQSAGHNLVFGGDTCGFGGNGDIVNTGDPKLGPLQGNGGPTATQALGSGSAALDAGNPAPPGSGGNACEATDQRGLPRTIDGNFDGTPRCDIGAAEGGRWLAVDTTVDSNDPSTYQVCDSDPNNGNCSLRGAISVANADSAVDAAYVITLPATGAANPYRITLPGQDDLNTVGDLDVRTDVTIVGGGALTTIVDGNALDRVFTAYARLALQDLTVQNGRTTGGGGGILVGGTNLGLLRVRLRNNVAGQSGGIAVLAGLAQITDSAITGNTANGSPSSALGGGVHNVSSLRIQNSTIAGNLAYSEGGGLFSNGVTTLANVTIVGNSAGTFGVPGLGGGVRLSGGSVSSHDSIIAGNNVNLSGTNPNCSGTLGSLGFNLVFGSLENCGLTVGTDIHGQDPKLGSLALNGGSTETMVLGAGSAAIDRGNPITPGAGGASCAAADQRGIARPLDGDAVNGPRCDIGAYEAPPCTNVRPNVALGVGSAGSNTITATITAGLAPITRVRGIPAKSSNILVDINGLIGQGPGFDTSFGGNLSSVPMTLRRAINSGSGTLAFIVTDGCGDWETLAGGGIGAWGTGSGPNPAPLPAPTATPTPGPSGTPGSSVTPGPTATAPVPGAACATFPSHAAAQAHLRADPRDPLLMDRNRNGIACEGADGAGFVNPPLDHVPVVRP